MNIEILNIEECFVRIFLFFFENNSTPICAIINNYSIFVNINGFFVVFKMFYKIRCGAKFATMENVMQNLFMERIQPALLVLNEHM